MMYHEFITVCGVTELEFDPGDYHTFIELFYAESADIPDVGSKEAFARFFAANRKAFDRLKNTLRGVYQTSADNWDRASQLKAKEDSLARTEGFLAKREEVLKESVRQLRKALDHES